MIVVAVAVAMVTVNTSIVTESAFYKKNKQTNMQTINKQTNIHTNKTKNEQQIKNKTIFVS